MKILYVEDDAHASENLRLFLQATGHEGSAARTGEEALKLFSGEFDLVLCDLHLPDWDGIQLIIRFKKLKPEMPIIALTGYALTSERSKCLNAGCTAYLSKPYDFSQLMKLIQLLVEGKQGPSRG